MCILLSSNLHSWPPAIAAMLSEDLSILVRESWRGGGHAGGTRQPLPALESGWSYLPLTRGWSVPLSVASFPTTQQICLVGQCRLLGGALLLLLGALQSWEWGVGARTAQWAPPPGWPQSPQTHTQRAPNCPPSFPQTCAPYPVSSISEWAHAG